MSHMRHLVIVKRSTIRYISAGIPQSKSDQGPLSSVITLSVSRYFPALSPDNYLIRATCHKVIFRTVFFLATNMAISEKSLDLSKTASL